MQRSRLLPAMTKNAKRPHSEAFAPAEAKRIMDRLDLVFTPKHGSWLNIAEYEPNMLPRQSLGGRRRPGRGLVPQAERRPDRRRLARHHRRRANQTQEAVP